MNPSPYTSPRRAFAVTLLLALAAPLLILGVTQGALGGDPGSSGIDAMDLVVRAVRTSPTEASVLGVAPALESVVELLVDGRVVGTAVPRWNLDYWFLHVPVSDGSLVQVRIGPLVSPLVTVPDYEPRPPAGPPGFLSIDGTTFVVNGTRVQLFGVNEPTAFPYALIASGLYGWRDPETYWGRNRLFPSGPDAYIENVSNPDELWREYFRYFLHYREAAGGPGHPPPNVLRIWIVDENFGLEKAYDAWKADPVAFWRALDALVYWAGRAGIYLVPVLGHMDVERDNRMYDVTSEPYRRHLELVRAVVARYEDSPTIAMWDLWNEADVNNDAFWASVGGIVGYRAWAETYLADVKPYSRNHPLTLGTGGWTLFPGVPSFGWQYHFFWNDIEGLEVSHHHAYGTAEDDYLVEWQTAWHEALGIPHYTGEFGYNLYPGPSGIGTGYWPWFADRALTAGWPGISTMVFLDNGRGAYSNYAYLGGLPEYGPGDPPPVDRVPVAAFSILPESPIVAAPVLFNALISSDDVEVVRYEWSFGDGGIAVGPVVLHRFHGVREYPVTLTVTDASGQVDSWTMVVRVSPVGIPPLPRPSPIDTGGWVTGADLTRSRLSSPYYHPEFLREVLSFEIVLDFAPKWSGTPESPPHRFDESLVCQVVKNSTDVQVSACLPPP